MTLCTFHFMEIQLQFVYHFRTDWNFLIKFCISDSSFNINIWTSLYLKCNNICACASCNYTLQHIIYKFLDMV